MRELKNPTVFQSEAVKAIKRGLWIRNITKILYPFSAFLCSSRNSSIKV